MSELREKISRWISLSGSQWWGSIIVYISIFSTAYLTIWGAIEPLSIPEWIQFQNYFIERRVLHVLASIFIAAHCSLFISMLVTRITKNTRSLGDKIRAGDLTHQLKNMYTVVNSFKNEAFQYFLPLVKENFAIDVTEGELKQFREICFFTTTTLRASLLDHFRTRGIEIGEDVSISVKLVISSNQIIKLFRHLSDSVKQQILEKHVWVVTVYRDVYTYVHKREREVGTTVYDIARNTAFQQILNKGEPFFLSNDLRGLPDYQDENPSWREQYNATLVVPIRYSQPGQQVTFGFLVVDSLNRNGALLYDDVVPKYILSHAADLIATFFMSLALPKAKSQDMTTADVPRQKESEIIQPMQDTPEVSAPLSVVGEAPTISITTNVTGSFIEDALKKGQEIQIQPLIIRITGENAKQNEVSILFLAADPTDASRLRLGEELREIQEKLRLSKRRDKFVLHQRMSVRPADITQALLDIQPDIIHFSGHGAYSGALFFENQLGKIHPIQPDALAALFAQFTDDVKCVLLNACYSEVQAEAIVRHVQYAIGMNRDIGDQAAIAFAIGFYQALGAGRTIEEAYALGCVQIRLHGIPEHLTPVLKKKGRAQP